jgi:hypothetical protein
MNLIKGVHFQQSSNSFPYTRFEILDHNQSIYHFGRAFKIGPRPTLNTPRNRGINEWSIRSPEALMLRSSRRFV